MKGFISILLDDDSIWLQEGSSIVDSLEVNETNLYRISVPTNEDVDLYLMFFAGYPQVYINYNYETNISNFDDGPFQPQTNNPQSFMNIKIPSREARLK